MQLVDLAGGYTASALSDARAVWIVQSLTCVLPSLSHLDVCLCLQVDWANSARGDGEDPELLLCRGWKNWRSVVPGRMSGLCDCLHHLPLHGDTIREGNKSVHNICYLLFRNSSPTERQRELNIDGCSQTSRPDCRRAHGAFSWLKAQHYCCTPGAHSTFSPSI